MICVENDEEAHALTKVIATGGWSGSLFREITSDLSGQEDWILLRFLRAREYNIKKADEMLRKSLQWRIDKQIDDIFQWAEDAPKFLFEEFEFYKTGYDFQGSAVIWCPLGKYNGRLWFERGFKQELIKLWFFMCEKGMIWLKESGFKQLTLLIDMEGLTFWKMASVDVMQQLFQNLQDVEQHYPEVAKHIIFINIPWIFKFGYDILSPIASSRSLAKVKLFNSDRSKFLGFLLQIMPESSVPQIYLTD